MTRLPLFVSGIIALFLAGTTSAQGIPACMPPDTLAIRAWAAEGQGNDTLPLAQSGLIASENPPTGGRRLRLLQQAVGSYPADLMSWQRRSPIPHWTTIYFSLHTPDTRELETVRSRYRLDHDPDLVGYLWGSSWFAKDSLYPGEPRSIFALATSPRANRFRIEGLPGCDDCGSFELMLEGAATLRGWWGPDGAIVPESLKWFCAQRL
jgi:hypothetical protein